MMVRRPRRFVCVLSCVGALCVLLPMYALRQSAGQPQTEVYATRLDRAARLPKHVSEIESPDSAQGEADLVHTDQELALVKLKPTNTSTPSNTYTSSSFQNFTNARETDGQRSSLRMQLKEKFPHFMIVGFGKAGTRALYDALRLHPQLAGPEKEERFFTNKYKQGLTKYLSTFPDRPLGGFLIEKSPDYILQPQVPSRIIKAAKDSDRNINNMVFIVITRDPISRAMSEYLEWNVQRKLHKNPPLPSFDEMVLKEGVVQAQQPFINASCYAYHIRNWLRTFSEEQMCYVDGDAFVKDPLKQIQNLESCMGLQHFFSDENFVYNKKRGFYCFQKGTDKHCMGGAKGRPHPQIAVAVRTQLVQHFQQCNSGLSHFTGPEIHY